jgi:hypothetical protein
MAVVIPLIDRRIGVGHCGLRWRRRTSSTHFGARTHFSARANCGARANYGPCSHFGAGSYGDHGRAHCDGPR